MNSLLAPDQTLELLDRLRRGLEGYTAGTRELEQERERDLSRLDRHHRHARLQFDEQRAAAQSEAQTA